MRGRAGPAGRARSPSCRTSPSRVSPVCERGAVESPAKAGAVRLCALCCGHFRSPASPRLSSRLRGMEPRGTFCVRPTWTSWRRFALCSLAAHARERTGRAATCSAWHTGGWRGLPPFAVDSPSWKRPVDVASSLRCPPSGRPPATLSQPWNWRLPWCLSSTQLELRRLWQEIRGKDLFTGFRVCHPETQVGNAGSAPEKKEKLRVFRVKSTISGGISPAFSASGLVSEAVSLIRGALATGTFKAFRGQV